MAPGDVEKYPAPQFCNNNINSKHLHLLTNKKIEKIEKKKRKCIYQVYHLSAYFAYALETVLASWAWSTSASRTSCGSRWARQALCRAYCRIPKIIIRLKCLEKKKRFFEINNIVKRLAYVFLGQVTHALAAVLPILVLYVPAGQGVHFSAAVTLL